MALVRAFCLLRDCKIFANLRSTVNLLVVLDDGGDLGLLQHHLAHPDLVAADVGVRLLLGGGAPGQGAAAGVIPAQQRGAETSRIFYTV